MLFRFRIVRRYAIASSRVSSRSKILDLKDFRPLPNKSVRSRVDDLSEQADRRRLLRRLCPGLPKSVIPNDFN